MKRALAILAVASMFGFAGFAQFSGEWDTNIHVLSSLSLDYTKLTINYEWSGWTFTSVSKFTASGYSDQSFDVSGTLGATSIEGSMSFLPAGKNVLKDISHEFTYEKDWGGLSEDLSFSYAEDKWEVEGPLYLSSSLSTSMDFAGVSLGLDITHETNYVATFDEICPNLIYGESYSYEVQTTSNSGSIAVTDYRRTWTPESPVGCCYSKCFVTGQPEVLLAEVTIKGTKGGEEVSTTLSGPFEVTFLDEDALSADTTHEFAWSSEGSTPVGGITWEYGILSDDGIELGVASSTYIYDYLDYLVAEEGWDPTFIIEYDPDDLSIKFLLPSYTTLTLTAEADPFKAVVVFDDVCTGIQFKEATVSLSDLSLCCGISYDAELAFNKCKGFDYLEFTAKDLFPICCGISFDMSVKFTTNTKEVSIKPKMEDIGEACFALYADVNSSGGESATLALNGLEVYGWKIRCDLAECNYIEIVSFLNPGKASDYGYKGVFKGDEFQYAKLGFCGPGCCGGNYSVDLSVFFDDGGGLFGISRLGADMAIPVMSNFTVNSSFAVKTGGDTTLDVGWTFTF